MLMKITSARRAGYAVELLLLLFNRAGLKNAERAVEFNEIERKSKLTLVSENLIRFEGSDENIKAAIAKIWEKHDKSPVRLSEAVSDIIPKAEKPLPEAEDSLGYDEENEALGDDLLPGEAVDAVDENGHFISKIKYDYSFEAKLSLSATETKEYYNAIVAFARSWGVKVSRSWKRERIYLGRNHFATLIFKGYKLGVALALDPKEYIDTKYKPIDISDVKKYQKTPMLMKITSQRKVKQTLELLSMLFDAAGINNRGVEVKTKAIPQKSKKALLNAGLIRKSEK